MHLKLSVAVVGVFAVQSDPSGSTSQDSQQQNAETRPPARKRQGIKHASFQ